MGVRGWGGGGCEDLGVSVRYHPMRQEEQRDPKEKKKKLLQGRQIRKTKGKSSRGGEGLT